MSIKKITITLLVSYFLLCVIAFLIYPLIENINYIDQFKEGFLFIVFIVPGFIFFTETIELDLKSILFGVILLLGNIIPIIFIYKKKKLFPFIIISIIFFCIYLFIGIVAFGIRKGE